MQYPSDALIQLGKRACRARPPQCGICVVSQLCETGLLAPGLIFFSSHGRQKRRVERSSAFVLMKNYQE